MRVKRLTLVDFKNHSNRNFLFNKKIVCITGHNGVGKTNVLDALYYLSFSKSFISSVDNINIRTDADFFTIRGIYEIDGMDENIVLSFSRQKGKTLKRNDKEYEKVSDHIGLIPLVLISPQDTRMIFDGSAERRKFIDSAVAQYDKMFLAALQNYNRALMQRNKYLKSTNIVFDPQLLAMWDMQLVANADKIYQGRKDFINNFVPEFVRNYQQIASNGEMPQLSYQSQLDSDSLENLLKTNIEKDRILQYTSCGIHKDDLIFSIDGLPIKNCGSQGQQKTFLAALKLAQYNSLCSRGATPIILLDDIFDKLDSIRVQNIVNLIRNSGFEQIFITHTSALDLQRLFNGDTNFEIVEL